jgi:hypothetical protein
MPDERKRTTLTASQLADLLHQLDDVMMEAARLREQVTHQLTEHRRDDQQRLSPPRRRPRPKKKR